MISKDKKHGNVVVGENGLFSRREVAIYGTTCEEVAAFVDVIRKAFPAFNIGFADADHHEPSTEHCGTHWQQSGGVVKIEKAIPKNVYRNRSDLADVDLMIVNGNHFQAAKQLVICNPVKEYSLRKRAHELTNVICVFNVNNQDIQSGYISELVDMKVTPAMSNQQELLHFLNSLLLAEAPLYALIMAGGKSVRMGRDKTRMRYHQEEQFKHVYLMFQRMNIKPFISCRADQREFFESQGCDVLVDRITDLGPMGGIISAFMSYPDRAFFVLACDLPLVDEITIRELLDERNHAFVATAFQSPYDKFPEPLISIWEPKAYPIMMQFLAQGYSCPRKVLINSNAHIVKSLRPERLANVNTADDIDEINDLLKISNPS